jgi:hypothetical protein
LQRNGFISPHLSTDPTVTRAYEIRIQAVTSGSTEHVDCHGNPTAHTYYTTAVPLRRNATKLRAFAVDQNKTIWYDATGVAPKPPFSDSASMKRLESTF